jgi:hypothetical protein
LWPAGAVLGRLAGSAPADEVMPECMMNRCHNAIQEAMEPPKPKIPRFGDPEGHVAAWSTR